MTDATSAPAGRAPAPTDHPLPSHLWLLMACNLVIGTGAFVISGILAAIGQDLQITISAAGQAMTAYALATAVLAPLALVITGKWPRRRVLWVALLVFAAGNGLCAAAVSLPMLLAGRVLMGVGAVFTPVAASIAVASVPVAQRGRALSMVFLGVSLSYVVGLPMGAWLGLQHGWQVPVAVVAGAAVLCTLAVVNWLPADIQAPGASFAGLPALLREREVLKRMAVTLLYFAAIFCVFSYAGPVLTSLVPLSAQGLSFTLMLFGLSGVVGTLLGGWETDRHGPRRTLLVHLGVLILMMVLVPFTRGNGVLMVAAFMAWGIAGFGMMAPQQSRLAAIAPAQAPLLLSLNTSMLYLGTALGAAMAGAFAPLIGFVHLAWVGVPFAAASFWLVLRSRENTVKPAA